MQLIQVQEDRLATMLKALSHPTRLEIVRRLSQVGDQQCLDIAKEFNLAQSTISEHLRVLKAAGLIQQCGPGSRSGYCLDKETLVWLKQSIVAL